MSLSLSSLVPYLQFYLLPTLLALTIAAALVPLGYWLAWFQPLARAIKLATARFAPPDELPPLSLVVSAHNDVAALRRLVPELLRQEYPNELEIVLVDDRSTDDTSEYLQQVAQLFAPLVRLVTIKQTPPGLNAKKYALTLGIKVARHPNLLFTDADCVPATMQWAARLAAGFAEPDGDSGPVRVVLGFGGYEAHPTALNALVRYETLLTGALYLGAARAGRPYMGVGRNLAYEKSAWLATRGFSSHIRSLGGDDDLFVQDAVRQGLPVGVALHPDGQTTSLAPATWGHWWRQKRRHLRAGIKYRWPDRLRAGSLPISGVLFYFGAAGAFAFAPALAWPWLLGAWLVRLTGLSAGLLPVGVNLRRPIPFWALPALDLLYSALYPALAVSIYLAPPTRWK